MDMHNFTPERTPILDILAHGCSLFYPFDRRFRPRLTQEELNEAFLVADKFQFDKVFTNLSF